MTWLYRLQQRLSLTRREGIAILTLAVLFAIGLTVRHIRQQQRPPLPADSLTIEERIQGASTVSPMSSAPSGPSSENPLPLNTASVNELQALPGIGPALSERIVKYRKTQRPFQQVDELRRVRGIGPATLADLRPLVVIETDSAR